MEIQIIMGNASMKCCKSKSNKICFDKDATYVKVSNTDNVATVDIRKTNVASICRIKAEEFVTCTTSLWVPSYDT